MEVLTATTIDPLTVIPAADVDAWSNDFRGAADSRIPGILNAAIGHAEAMLNRAVLEQTRRTVTRCYPLDSLKRRTLFIGSRYPRGGRRNDHRYRKR